MAKYLIVTKEKDFVSSSKNAKNHTYATNCKGVMVYDVDGNLVDSSSTNGDGVVVREGTRFADGEPRAWTKEFLKNHKTGDSVPDATGWYFKDFLPKQQNLTA